MSTIQAFELLTTLAKVTKKQREGFSKEEITRKIAEIKYLSSQKRTPKLTLRKEIIHLESLLQRVLELDEKIAKEKRHESAQMASLKRQNTVLKKKLAVLNDKKLDKKLDSIHHVLGDSLAKKDTVQQVRVAVTKPQPVMNIRDRITHLKSLVRAAESKDPDKARELALRITRLEETLDHPKIKHKVMFKETEKENKEAEKSLPLPPPPKLVVG